MASTRTLLLLRHAEAEATRPGRRDRDRRLTERGHEQAQNVGETIRTAGWTVDHVLCSPAVRVAETVAGLGLPDDVDVEVVESLFDAGADSILEMIMSLPGCVGVVLVVGHAPGVPGVLHTLTTPATADPAAWSVVESRFPPATLTALTVTDWSDLSSARLVRAVPH